MLSFEALQTRADRRWLEVGFKRITAHECRHTCATWLDAAGVRPVVVSRLMGSRAARSSSWRRPDHAGALHARSARRPSAGQGSVRCVRGQVPRRGRLSWTIGRSLLTRPFARPWSVHVRPSTVCGSVALRSLRRSLPNSLPAVMGSNPCYSASAASFVIDPHGPARFRAFRSLHGHLATCTVRKLKAASGLVDQSESAAPTQRSGRAVLGRSARPGERRLDTAGSRGQRMTASRQRKAAQMQGLLSGAPNASASRGMTWHFAFHSMGRKLDALPTDAWAPACASEPCRNDRARRAVNPQRVGLGGRGFESPR